MADTDADSSSKHEPPESPRLESGASGALEECPRCGSILPEGDEGLCPTCGRPFGFKTQQMDILTPDVLARHGYASQAPELVEEQMADELPSRRARATAIAVLVTVLVLVGVLVVILLSSQ